MKTTSVKTLALSALFFIPFISEAKELPPVTSLPTDGLFISWAFVIAGGAAVYGLFKMWSNNPSTK